MRLFNRTENPNAIVGLFLLILLAVFAGPNTLPRLLADVVPFADEGVPCVWLREADNRASHQSLIGRTLSNQDEPPISLGVRTSQLNPTDPNQNFSITVVVNNQTLGTIPVLITPDDLILDPNQPRSGLGVVFNSDAAVPSAGETVDSYPSSRIRLLGPRQRCVHRVTYALNDERLPPISSISFGNATIKAFYRNNTRGTAVPSGTAPAVYTDQGLWTGVVESELKTIRVAGQ